MLSTLNLAINQTPAWCKLCSPALALRRPSHLMRCSKPGTHKETKRSCQYLCDFCRSKSLVPFHPILTTKRVHSVYIWKLRFAHSHLKAPQFRLYHCVHTSPNKDCASIEKLPPHLPLDQLSVDVDSCYIIHDNSQPLVHLSTKN